MKGESSVLGAVRSALGGSWAAVRRAKQRSGFCCGRPASSPAHPAEHGMLRGPIAALQRRILHTDMPKKYPGAYMYSLMPLELVAADSGNPEQASFPPESPLQCAVESAPSAQCMIVAVKHCRVCTVRPMLGYDG